MKLREESNKSFSDHFQDWDFLEKLIDKYVVAMSTHDIRKKSWQISVHDLEQAERENRPISLGEWKAGLRKEHFEWEVREAILMLWKKGYTTYFSGYGEGSNGLHEINFVSLERPPEKFLKSIWALTDKTGIPTWTYGPGQDDTGFPGYNSGHPVWLWAIHFLDTRGNPQLLKNHWDKIAASLPSLGWQQLTNNLPFAEEFRRTHKLST